MSAVIVNTDEILGQINNRYVSPEDNPDTRNGFFDWLGNNYVGVTEAAANIACIFDPRRCAGSSGSQGQQSGNPYPQQKPTGPSVYLLIAIAVILLGIVIIILKR
jgi:hypothetical protein